MPSVPIGSVISQDPAALAPQKQGTVVNLVVSQGKGKISVPNVTGQSGDTAKQLLESPAFGFVVTLAEEANDSVPKGSVIRTDPAADTVVDKGGAVTVYVSTGPTQVAVPLLIGLTETKAIDLLHEKGLIESITYQDVPFDNPNDKRGDQPEPSRSTRRSTPARRSASWSAGAAGAHRRPRRPPTPPDVASHHAAVHDHHHHADQHDHRPDRAVTLQPTWSCQSDGEALTEEVAQQVVARSREDALGMELHTLDRAAHGDGRPSRCRRRCAAVTSRQSGIVAGSITSEW